MVTATSSQLDRTFAALADPTRRSIISCLSHGDCSVSELAEPHEMSLPAISKHLRVLEKAGLIEQQREGRVRRCVLHASPLKSAADWVEAYRIFWEAQFDSLEQLLEQQNNPDQNNDCENQS
ncbi:Transcriptional repressor SdpR [Poriferisphaera corsica]|uniref:Transcriptional repressor SdpR n=1 Tax=Poriferisphaera corsica TaxID=2528020 RepID=A0A517YZH1_9BACT|nr:metalloregulator ArsR/SmtB family transcription factor [Poriferisphaera corsica]QDU35614.1 Transcriptional repressor SdpR [Poriferisphaera corsica]